MYERKLKLLNDKMSAWRFETAQVGIFRSIDGRWLSVDNAVRRIVRSWGSVSQRTMNLKGQRDCRNCREGVSIMLAFILRRMGLRIQMELEVVRLFDWFQIESLVIRNYFDRCSSWHCLLITKIHYSYWI